MARRRRVPRTAIHPEAKAVDWGPNRRAQAEPSADGGAITMARGHDARSEAAACVVGGKGTPAVR